MTKETKAVKADTSEMLAVFEAYRQANDTRLAEIETRGASDPLTDERLARIDRRVEALSLKMARPEAAGPDTGAEERSEAWARYLRSGDESGVNRLDLKSLNTGTGSEGGHVAPPELDRLIEARLLAASPMRQIATVRQTSAGVYKKPVGLGAAAAWVRVGVATWLRRGRDIADNWTFPDAPNLGRFAVEFDSGTGFAGGIETGSATCAVPTGTIALRVAEIGMDGRRGPWLSIGPGSPYL